MNAEQLRRVLVIDDMPAIHQDFAKILAAPVPAGGHLDALKAALFDAAPATAAPQFELESALQGEAGLAAVQRALQLGRPFALAFVDMRMPPGWDGLETIEQLWQADPLLQVVLCTAHSDYSWQQVLSRLDAADRLLVLKKPFDSIEVYQMATTLSAKWNLARKAAAHLQRIESAVIERTRELSQANSALQQEIVDRKNLESQLIQSEKLASLGQLTAGVAHEINNPLGYISSNFSSLQSYVDALVQMLAGYERVFSGFASPAQLAERDALRAALDLDFVLGDVNTLMGESRQGIERVRQIVVDLKEFSRSDADCDWQMSHLHDAIESALNLVAQEIKDHAVLVRQFGDLPNIACRPLQIGQVLMHLLRNATQAMGEQGGTITIRTGADAQNVWLEIADDGCGIAPDKVGRVFDPFYTSKAIGSGTGLGLSIAYGIVQQHSGQISVSSQVGAGTCFRVVLPILQASRGLPDV